MDEGKEATEKKDILSEWPDNLIVDLRRNLLSIETEIASPLTRDRVGLAGVFNAVIGRAPSCCHVGCNRKG